MEGFLKNLIVTQLVKNAHPPFLEAEGSFTFS